MRGCHTVAVSSQPHTPSQPAAVLFDMDGTLIDTEPLWGIATYELGELLGRPLTPEVRAKTVGGSFANTLGIVAKWAGYSLVDGDLEHYRTWMYARMGELFAEGIECNPGVAGILASLAQRGTRVAGEAGDDTDIITVCSADRDWAVRTIASLAGSVVRVEPEDIRQDVVKLLRTAVEGSE